MSKQTAVEWLVEEIEKHYIVNNAMLNPEIVMQLKRQAKEMEKEQIILIAEYIRVASQSSPNVTTKDLFNEYQSLQRNL